MELIQQYVPRQRHTVNNDVNGVSLPKDGTTKEERWHRSQPYVADTAKRGDAHDDQKDGDRTTIGSVGDSLNSVRSSSPSAPIPTSSNKAKPGARPTPSFSRRVRGRTLSGSDYDGVDVEPCMRASTPRTRPLRDIFGGERLSILPGTTTPPSLPLTARSPTSVGSTSLFRFSVPIGHRGRKTDGSPRMISFLATADDHTRSRRDNTAVPSELEHDAVEGTFAWGGKNGTAELDNVLRATHGAGYDRELQGSRDCHLGVGPARAHGIEQEPKIPLAGKTEVRHKKETSRFCRALGSKRPKVHPPKGASSHVPQPNQQIATAGKLPADKAEDRASHRGLLAPGPAVHSDHFERQLLIGPAQPAGRGEVIKQSGQEPPLESSAARPLMPTQAGDGSAAAPDKDRRQKALPGAVLGSERSPRPDHRLSCVPMTLPSDKLGGIRAEKVDGTSLKRVKQCTTMTTVKDLPRKDIDLARASRISAVGGSSHEQKVHAETNPEYIVSDPRFGEVDEEAATTGDGSKPLPRETTVLAVTEARGTLLGVQPKKLAIFDEMDASKGWSYAAPAVPRHLVTSNTTTADHNLSIVPCASGNVSSTTRADRATFLARCTSGEGLIGRARDIPLGRQVDVLFTPKLSQNPNMSAVSGDVGGLEAQRTSKPSFQDEISTAVVREGEQRVGVNGSAQIMASKDELARRESEWIPVGEEARREVMEGKPHESGPAVQPVWMPNPLYAHKALEVSEVKQDIPRVFFVDTRTKVDAEPKPRRIRPASPYFCQKETSGILLRGELSAGSRFGGRRSAAPTTCRLAATQTSTESEVQTMGVERSAPTVYGRTEMGQRGVGAHEKDSMVTRSIRQDKNEGITPGRFQSPQRAREADGSLSAPVSAFSTVRMRGGMREQGERSHRLESITVNSAGADNEGEEAPARNWQVSNPVLDSKAVIRQRHSNTPRTDLQEEGHGTAERDVGLPFNGPNVRQEKGSPTSYYFESVEDAADTVGPMDSHPSKNELDTFVDGGGAPDRYALGLQDACVSHGTSMSWSPLSTDFSPQGPLVAPERMLDKNPQDVSMENSQSRHYEEYRPTGFVFRQEPRQLEAERERKDALREEGMARRELGVRGSRCMNRNSRNTLARGGRSSHQDQASVSERLARAPEETGLAGYVAEGWEHTINGTTREPFQPSIDARSRQLSSKMNRGHGCTGYRLHSERAEKLRKWKRRVQLADQMLREKAAASYVQPLSKRILTRKFRSRMYEVLAVVDAERKGWLTLGGLERVMSECGMLPSEERQEYRDDILFAVWRALSEQIYGSGDDEDSHGNVGRVALACGVPVGRLSELLVRVVSGSEGSAARNREQRYSHPQFRCNNYAAPLSPSVVWRSWRGEERSEKAPHAIAPVDDDFVELCKALSEVFKTNRPSRSISTKGNKTARNDKCDTIAVTSGGEGLARSEEGSPVRTVTPAQVAAMSSRFDENARARTHKIEEMREAEEVRENDAHPFQPCMLVTSKGPALRRKAALVMPEKSAVECLSRKVGGCGSNGQTPAEEHSSFNHRTSEDREVDEKCTFRPRLFHPVPVSPPRYPTQIIDGEPIHSAPGVGNRSFVSWHKLVARLREGRKQHLRRLETEHTNAARREPLPPSVQQLFADAGIQPHERHPQNRDPCMDAKNRSGGPPKLCLEGRIRARHRWEEKVREDQGRRSAEETARREKRKRVLARACRRAAAGVGLEAALSAREAERGSWDPPVVIAEIEFVQRKKWVLLPLWADTCPSEAVGELVQQHHIKEAVARELEISLKNEIERGKRAILQECASSSELEKNTGRGQRRAIPKVMLRVDTADTPPSSDLRERFCVHSSG